MTAAYLGVLSSTARINAFLTSNNLKCVPDTLLASGVGTRGGAVWSGGLVLVPVFARFFQEDKHKAQYISLKGLLASYGRGKNRQFEPANRLYLTREFP